MSRNKHLIVLEVLLSIYLLLLAIYLGSGVLLLYSGNLHLSEINTHFEGQLFVYALFSLIAITSLIMMILKTRLRFRTSATLLLSLAIETQLYRLIFSNNYSMDIQDLFNWIIFALPLILILYLHKNASKLIIS